MSYPGTPYASYAIHTDAEFVGCPPQQHIRTQLRLDDVSALPVVVKELTKMGYDLSDTAKALREAEEEQQKRKLSDELEENRRIALAGLETKLKRFVIAYNKVGKTSVGLAEGVTYKDSCIYIVDSWQHPFDHYYSNEEKLTSFAKDRGYELFIKRFD